MSMSRKDTGEPTLTPNETTIQAMKDARAGRVSGRFATVAELLADLNAGDTPEAHEGSTNAYADLGHHDADEMLLKARIVTKIGETIKARQLSAERAATVLGVTPAELHELLAGRFRSHSVDDLERMASMLDKTGR